MTATQTDPSAAARPRPRTNGVPNGIASSTALTQQGGGISLGAPRTGPAQTTQATGIQPTPAVANSWMKRGAAARAAVAQAEQEKRQQAEQRAANPYVPREFFLKPGEATDFIVLDVELGPHVWRHRWWDEEKRESVVELCPKEFESCCLCNQETSVDSRPSDFVAYLTGIDYRSYVSQRTGKTVPYTKKLLIVQLSEIPFFNKLFDELGTLRGVQLFLSRPTKGDPQNGIMEFKALVPEEVLAQYFNNAEEHDAYGNIIKPAGADMHPAEYEAFLERPSNARLIQKYNGSPTFGSEQANTGNGQDDGWNGFDPKGVRRGGFQATETTQATTTAAGLGYDEGQSQSYSTSDLEAMSRTPQTGGIQRSAPQTGGMDFTPMDDDIPF